MPASKPLSAFLLAATLLPGGASAEIPAAMAQGIDRVFSGYTKPGSPGCSFALIDKGRIVYEKGYGLASIEHAVPIEPARTVFDIASVSKQFTAASILLLAKDNRLSLDDDVRKYVPELPDVGSPVTLRHLLHHTGGVPDYTLLLLLGGMSIEDYTNTDDALRAIARQKQLDFAPGSKFGYSNSGYFLLSQVVTRVSGQPLREFAQQRIFDPLGMTHTRILDDHTAVVANRASSYDRGEKGDYKLSLSNWEQTGDGAVQTTVDDMAKWDRNFDEPKVGGAWLVEQLQTQGKLNDGRTIKYARGLSIERYRGQPIVRHAGAWMGFRSSVMRFPQQRVTTMALCNIGDADTEALLHSVADLYLAKQLAPASTAPPSLEGADRYIGTYANVDEGLVRGVARRDGKLWYTGSGWGDTELVPVGDGRFEFGSGWGSVEFPDTPASPRRMLFQSDDNAVDLVEIEPVTLTPDALRAYEGAYASAQLDTRWTLKVEGGQLGFQGKRGPRAPLTPVLPDVFSGPFELLLQFQRDAAGRVQGFSVKLPRTAGFRFVRTADGK